MVAAVVGGGIRSAISVSRSRRIRPVPVFSAMAMAGVTSAVGRGATLDAAKIGLAAVIETAQSGSTIETGRTTGDVARRCARAAMGQKASDRSGRRTTEGKTADA